MTNSDRYTIAGAIYMVIALVFIGAFSVAIWGLFHGGQPALAMIAMIFGIFGFTSMTVGVVSFRRALSA